MQRDIERTNSLKRRQSVMAADNNRLRSKSVNGKSWLNNLTVLKWKWWRHFLVFNLKLMRFEWGATCATSRYFWTTQLHSFENQWKSLIGWVVLKCCPGNQKRIMIPKNPEILKKSSIFHWYKKLKALQEPFYPKISKSAKSTKSWKKVPFLIATKKLKALQKSLNPEIPKAEILKKEWIFHCYNEKRCFTRSAFGLTCSASDKN